METEIFIRSNSSEEEITIKWYSQSVFTVTTDDVQLKEGSDYISFLNDETFKTASVSFLNDEEYQKRFLTNPV